LFGLFRRIDYIRATDDPWHNVHFLQHFMYPRLVIPWRRWFGIGKDWQTNNRAQRNRAPASAAFMAVGAAAGQRISMAPPGPRRKGFFPTDLRACPCNMAWSAGLVETTEISPRGFFFFSGTDGTVNASEGIK
jgi:hypothetical protein